MESWDDHQSSVSYHCHQCLTWTEVGCNAATGYVWTRPRMILAFLPCATNNVRRTQHFYVFHEVFRKDFDFVMTANHKHTDSFGYLVWSGHRTEGARCHRGFIGPASYLVDRVKVFVFFTFDILFDSSSMTPSWNRILIFWSWVSKTWHWLVREYVMARPLGVQMLFFKNLLDDVWHVPSLPLV